MNRAEALDYVKSLTMDDRNKTHGEPIEQFETAQALKRVMGFGTEELAHLLPAELEAMESICTKLSRIKHGRPLDPAKWADHGLDIIGYAAIWVQAGQQRLSTSSDRVTFTDCTYESDPETAALARRLAPENLG